MPPLLLLAGHSLSWLAGHRDLHPAIIIKSIANTFFLKDLVLASYVLYPLTNTFSHYYYYYHFDLDFAGMFVSKARLIGKWLLRLPRVRSHCGFFDREHTN